MLMMTCMGIQPWKLGPLLAGGSEQGQARWTSQTFQGPLTAQAGYSLSQNARTRRGPMGPQVQLPVCSFNPFANPPAKPSQIFSGNYFGAAKSREEGECDPGLLLSMCSALG